MALAGPQNLVFDARTRTLWVTNRTGQSIAEVDPQDTKHILSSIDGINTPNGIALAATKHLAYVTNREAGSVTEVDLDAHRVVRVIPTGREPFGVAVDEETGDVYVANTGSSSVSVVSAKDGRVTEFPWSTEPLHIAVSSKSSVAWVVSRNGAVQSITRGQIDRAMAIDSSGFDLALLSGEWGIQAGYITGPSRMRVTQWNRAVEFQGILHGFPYLAMTNPPYAVANLPKCLGVVVPAEDMLYTFAYGSDVPPLVHKIGKQGPPGAGGGQGLAYDITRDTAFVANYAENSITAIAHPCNPYSR